MKTVQLPSGKIVPALGMGTWMMGDAPSSTKEEIATLQEGIDLGLTLIDTAEMYGEGDSEKLIGKAIKGRRDQCFLVSKVYPHNASKRGIPAACERSLKRLNTDVIDLYLLHWRGQYAFAETIAAFEQLKREGKIRHWGVSNLDLRDMSELTSAASGKNVAVNQVLYNLSRRGIERDLMPWCEENHIPLMAYSPIEQSRLLKSPHLIALAKDLHITPAQLALAWVLWHKQVIAIPKTGKRTHLKENAHALEVVLSPEVLKTLDALFPPPKAARPLEML